MTLDVQDLGEVLADIERHRPRLVVHPDDEARVRTALAQLPLLTLAPEVIVSTSTDPGQAIRLPSQAQLDAWTKGVTLGGFLQG